MRASQITSRDSTEYRWITTVSFWIAASFIVGSALFTIGGLTSMANLLIFDAHDCPEGFEVRDVLKDDSACTDGMAPWKITGLVTHTYLSGGCYFTIGAYLGWFNVRG